MNVRSTAPGEVGHRADEVDRDRRGPGGLRPAHPRCGPACEVRPGCSREGDLDHPRRNDHPLLGWAQVSPAAVSAGGLSGVCDLARRLLSRRVLMHSWIIPDEAT